MHKPAPSDDPIHDLVRNRWSPRAFSGKHIPHDVLRTLFEAARWAPSSFNEQPWAFLVATKDDKEGYERVLSTLSEANQVWAKEAPVLGIAISKATFAGSGRPNRNALYDTGAAMAFLTVEATARGIFVHQMAGFDPQKAIERFQIPDGWEPIAAFAIGFPGDPQSLPEKLREREVGARSRKPLADFVMSGRWGQPAPFRNK